ncbi:putative 1-phosphatidylinositol 3-phosphate 5-kinase [Episyrphus balteatus]|uniref:putative 1-phosphatidylinositol 3-phosphate 5-kinase n=1 Tax=Episyrphus balteatus TaxID=286459 RepID=UPI002486C3BE|nr:putative 1-phosphatidylinositol 3-phosphate 5-kinase [Episyrphus balteatus]
MNQHLHSPHKLTEFARDFEEEPETLLSKFVSKIQNAYNASYNTVNDAPTGGSPSGPSTPTTASKSTSHSTFYADVESISRNSSSSSLSSANKAGNSQSNQDGSSSTTTTEETTSESVEKADETHPEATEGRTMLNVLKRISNIVAAKNSNLRNYKDTELQRFWMPDAIAKECYDCSQKFSAFRRKHHCRLCGQIFCSKCCNQVVPGTIIMCSGDLKVCNYCSKIVLSYLKSPNITDDLKLDLQALQEDLSSKLSQNNESDENLKPRSTLPRKVSVGYQEERFATNQINSLSNADRRNILQQSNSLIILHEEMIRQLPAQNCGLDLIDFLNTNQKSSNKIQAVAILSAMHAAGFLLPIVPDSDQIEFDENLHYKFAPKRPDVMTTGILEIDVDPESNVPNQNEYSPNKYDNELQPPKSLDMSLSFQSVKDVELENSIRSTTTTSKLLESYCDHEDQLLTQMLRSANLDQKWSKVLTPLCCRAANHFKPEYCTNELMDIRNYVNFKKVPGGKRQECTIVGGVVFSKNVAHKDMATRVDRPKILLLQCPIVYERVEGKFVSISTVLLQEKEYLRNVTARIMNFKPNVVLVHKNVAGIAQDMLRSHGITLVLDVKISVMERLSKALQCDIVSSIESNIGKPKLGMCDAFYIKNFDDGFGTTKTLMYFEKLSSPRGYTCLLRGGNNTELAKVKQVASFLVYARYNWRLEMSFLLDEFARPLSPKPLIFDSKEQSPSDDVVESGGGGGVLLRNDNNNDADVIDKPIQPTTKKLIERKSEDKLVTIENVNDFTDPLRSTDLQNNKLSPDSSIVELAVETPYDNRFRTALNSTILSVSPFLTFPLPYLETEQGRKCPLRAHFPKELFFSKQWSTTSNEKPSQIENETQKSIEGSTQLNPLHPFLTTKITTPIDNRELQTLLAEFRSFGGKYPKKKKMTKLKRRESFQKPQKVSEEQLYKDALDLENHQRLPVLFCSFYFNPKASSFCAQPTLLDMKFYGQQDIMLGQFLQRYCFRVSYICPLCDLPMMDHVRRYVHSMGCVQVFLNEDTIKNDPNRIYFTSWCSICNEVSPSVPISETTKCLSFAKYLELRFYGHAYKKRALEGDHDSELLQTKCNHSLNRDYIHYFTYNGIGAKFMYSPIEIWEIGLPPLVLHLKKPKPFHSFQVMEDIKGFSLAGHEVYSKIHEKIADFATEDETTNLANLKTSLQIDQFNFKKHVEVVQMLLIEKDANSYDINDGMIMAKRALAESIEVWGPRLHEMGLKAKSLYKHDSNQQIDSGQICTEDLRSDMESPTGDVKPITEGQEEIDVVPPLEKNRNQEHVTDKKSIKKMLSSLLPSTATANLLQSPLSSNEHLTLPLGTIPILVHDQDLSSIIAYSLTSQDYNKMVDMISHGSSSLNTVPTSSPNPKRKNDSQFDFDEKEIPKATEEEKKPSKSHSHIDMAFQDSTTHFTCRMFFAKEFDLLRANTLKVPKMGRNLFKELEHSKKREELKFTQKGSNSEMEIIRKASDPAIQTTPPEDEAGGVSQLQSDIEDTRTFLARSLCRSVQWEARGGKSGSKFSKTLDDRFVLKEMSPKDIAIFENFAPNYFDYINKCHQQNHPTLLAKIVGVYRVTIKKKDSFQEKFMLVMENLFYECDIKNKFDLKGSERNRLVNPTNQNGEIVLLDENLVQMSWSKPLYVLSHSKAVLKDAINRDSSFLAKNQVMDYSLLVGLNNKSSTLVLGIIDYIRTYTFDKRVETLLKTLGSGMGKQPTIIPPECYMKRFTDAMDRYFYTVPDRWEGLSKA